MRFLAIAILLVALVSSGTAWDPPYFTENTNEDIELNVDESDPKKHTLIFKEGIAIGTVLGYFTYEGDLNALPSVGGTDEALVKIETDEETDKWKLSLNQKVDYEDKPKHAFTVSKGSLVLAFDISLININNKDLIIDFPRTCNMDEENPEDCVIKDCIFTLKDEDGLDESLKITFSDKEFTMTDYKNEGQKELTLNLVSRKIRMYNEGSTLSFTITFKDNRDNIDASILLKINDIPNNPPEWNPALGTINIDEESELYKKIDVQDGDYFLNWDIICSLDCPATNEKCSKLFIDVKTCMLKIDPIKLDDPNNNIMEFDIKATEVVDPDYGDWPDLPMNNTQTVYLIIKDINNHKPIITVNKVSLDIKEGDIGKMDLEVNVTDMDSNDFGRYNVYLESTLTEDITDYLKITPSEGYQETPFSILINKPFDYDSPLITNPSFELTIRSKEYASATPPGSDPQGDFKKVTINILDLNDEIPEWEEDSYTIIIDETFGRDGDILELPAPTSIGSKDENINFFATDKDKEPEYNTITYEIIGSSAKKLLKLKKDTPNPRENLVLILNDIKSAQPFDFEREEEIIFTIQASDKKNSKSVQVTIKLNDINDEFPVLTATPPTEEIKEYTQDPNALKITLEGDDNDKGKKLKFDINYDESYATSQGTRMGWSEIGLKLIVTPDGDQSALITMDPKTLKTYQDYDTIYLETFVEDTEAQYPKDTKQIDKKTVVIKIKNIPDIPPKFDQTTLTDITVMETLKEGERITVIKASDPDLPGDWIPSLTFELVETADKKYVVLEDDGILKVSGQEEINADIDENGKGKDALKLIVKAKLSPGSLSDFREKEENLVIAIRDINNKKPKSDPQAYSIEIKEEAMDFELGDGVKDGKFTFDASDKDRDFVNHNFRCIFPKNDNIYNVITEGPEKGRKTGCTISVNDPTRILRDDKVAEHVLTVRIENHEDTTQDSSSTTQVTVKIIDINNNDPSVKKDITIEVDEDWREDSETGTVILGVDKDFDPDNIFITYTVSEVRKEKTKQSQNEETSLDNTFFEVITANDNIRNGKLRVKNTLRGHHGTYTLVLKAENTKATPPLSTEDNEVTLIINKFQFHAVEFVNIAETYILRSTQEINAPLFLAGDKKMDPLSATDGDGEKFDIEFTLEHDFFKVVEDGTRSATLMLKKLPEPNEDKFTFTLMAQIKDAKPQLPPAEQAITVLFLKDDSVPVFNVDKDIKCNIKEDEQKVLNCNIPGATIPGTRSFPDFNQNDINLNIYYTIVDDVPKNTYVIEDPKTSAPIVKVVKPIDLTKIPDRKSWFIVEASYQEPPKSSRGSRGDTKQNQLYVSVDVEDINNYPPEFKDKILKGTLLEKLNVGSEHVMYLDAVDPDVNDELIYSIDWSSYDSNGENLPGLEPKPFDISRINQTRSEIVLKVPITSSMSGQIEFNVKVVDDPPPENGAAHSDQALVRLYVIAEQNLVLFIFKNDINTINLAKDNLIEIFSEKFEYTAGVESVAPGDTVDLTTKVMMYFIDDESNSGVPKNVIEKKIMDDDFAVQLKTALIAVHPVPLLLDRVQRVVERESLEETYKIALIAVCCVLSLVIIGLIVFFALKIRATNARLRKINQTEVRRPTMVANLPGANKRATQVINPNINQELIHDDDDVVSELSFSRSSRHSKRSVEDDDEDFVGVENNDIFKISQK